MKLIFIYGPPASGKLTVAKELSKITGFRVFHNHLVFDMVTAVIPWANPRAKELFEELVLKMFREGVEQGIDGLIYTHVYRKPDHNEFIKKTIEIIDTQTGATHFIQLLPNTDTLKERVLGDSRRDHNKATSVETLEKVMKNYNVLETVPFKDSLVIDNTELSPSRVAQQIRDLILGTD